MNQVSSERRPNPVAELSTFMSKLKNQMALALPKHMNADRMTRLALTAFSTTPDLQLCTYDSIAGSIMVAAQMGLEPGVNGQGYLIPYKGRCTFVPGWKGIVDIASFCSGPVTDDHHRQHRVQGDADRKTEQIYEQGRVQ